MVVEVTKFESLSVGDVGGRHMKRDCPKRAEEKENKQKYGEGVNNKCVEVMGGQLHVMFTSSVDVLSETDFSEIGEDDDFTWHQFQVKGWGAQDFEGHALVAMHNATGGQCPSHGSSLMVS